MRGHPRIASCDSQAFGVQARQDAYRQRRPKTNALIEARIAAAAERLRDLHEHGEIEWTDVHPLAAYEMAFMD